MPDSSKVWNRLAKGYAASPIKDEATYERKLEITRRYMTPDMQVLEFGCGTGGTALRHAPHVARYRATDISEEMIAIGRDRAGSTPPASLSLEVAAFDEMEIEAGSLDMVLGLSILHLVPDARATIAKAHHVLKPGGLFVSSTVCLRRFRFLRPVAALIAALGFIPQVRFLGEDQLRKMMRAQGFEIVEDWSPKGSGQALFLVTRKAG